MKVLAFLTAVLSLGMSMAAFSLWAWGGLDLLESANTLWRIIEFGVAAAAVSSIALILLRPRKRASTAAGVALLLVTLLYSWVAAHSVPPIG